MKITREINGASVEIELTPEELTRAWAEQDGLNQMEDVSIVLDEYADYDGGTEEFKDEFGYPLEAARAHLSWLGNEKADAQGNGLTWREAVDEALDSFKRSGLYDEWMAGCIMAAVEG